MAYMYAVLGGGMQGTAAAYDMARFGDSERVWVADVDPGVAERSAARVNELTGRPVAAPMKLNVADTDAVQRLLEGCHGALSAVPYRFNEALTRTAIAARCALTDLGGNTEVVRAQHRLSAEAARAEISIVPDCGLAPGMGNTLAAYGMSMMDQPQTVSVRCGGLPKEPKPPLDYKLVFNIGGLTNEYFGTAWALREGQVVELATFSELESLEFPAPVGRCEAFVTTGGTSTCPWTYEGSLHSYDYKTVRYPGHHDKFKLLLDLGLLDETPVSLPSTEDLVSPRELFHRVVAPRLAFPEDRDLVVLRATVEGLEAGQPARIVLDVYDEACTETGFSAMERTTAYPASIVTIMATQGELPSGVLPLETAVPGAAFVSALERRGIPVRITRDGGGES